MQYLDDNSTTVTLAGVGPHVVMGFVPYPFGNSSGVIQISASGNTGDGDSFVSEFNMAYARNNGVLTLGEATQSTAPLVTPGLAGSSLVVDAFEGHAQVIWTGVDGVAIALSTKMLLLGTPS